MKTEDEQARQQRIEKLASINRAFASHIPFNNALGIELIEIGDAFALQHLPAGPHLVGDPERGTIHGGVITTLLDSCCGAAVFMALEKPAYMATLDLRIDFLRPADASTSLSGRAGFVSDVGRVSCPRSGEFRAIRSQAGFMCVKP